MKMPHLMFGLRYGKRLSPARDWAFILTTVILAIVISLGWNLWLFHEVTNGVTLGEAPEPTTAVLDQATIDKLAATLADRAAKAAAYRAGLEHFVDPSQ